MAEQPSYQAPVPLHVGWYGHTTLKQRDNRCIDQFHGVTWNANGELEAVCRVQTHCGLVMVRTPWRIYRGAPNAREVAGGAWHDAEEQYRESLGGGWLALFGYCLGYNPRLHLPASRPTSDPASRLAFFSRYRTNI